MGKNNKAEKAAVAAKDTTKAKETKKKVDETTVNNKNAEKVETPPKKTEKETPAQPEKKSTEKKAKKEAHVPEIIPEEVNNDNTKALQKASRVTGIPVGSAGSTAVENFNGKAQMAYVMQRRYAENEELRKNYPQLYDDLNRCIDVVVLLGLVDLNEDIARRNAEGKLELTINADQLLPLQETAAMLGIKLAPAKALPGTDGSQLSLDFTKSEVPEELKSDAGKSQDFEKVELDPKKVTTPEMLEAALTKLMSEEKNVANNIVNTVEWYRNYMLNKENNANKKLELDAYTVGDWLKEILSIAKNVSLQQGLGRTLYLYANNTGSPCMSHAIMHKYMAPCGWTEEEIADAVKILIGENFRLRLKDDEKLDAKKEAATQAIITSLGNEYIDNLFIDVTSSDDAKKEIAKKVYGTIRTNYFTKDHKPSDAEMRLKIGQIINLYRDPSDRLAEYEQESISIGKPSEYPETTEKKN